MKTKALLSVLGFCLSTHVLASNSHPVVSKGGNHHLVVIDGGMVRLRGAITAPACTVAAGSGNQIVEMGQLRSNQFAGLGSYASPVPFELSLTQCSTAVYEQVAITFLGVSDGKDPLVLRAGQGANAATGVGLAIFDSTGDIIPPNAQPRSLGYLSNGDTPLHFTARYRATSRQVTGGNADASAWFALSYH